MKKKPDPVAVPPPPKVPAPPTPDPNIEKILVIVTENRERMIALAQNLDVLTDEVNEQAYRLSKIAHQSNEILAILRQVFPPTSGSKLTQLKGDSMGPYSIKAGGSGTFLRSNLPVGSLGLFPGTVASYGVTDPAVQISSDPSDPTNPDKFQAAVAGTDTAPSFDVTTSITPVNADGSQGTPIVNTFTVTIVQVTPPGVPTTASDLTQTS
jgi:hypothetical protein